MNKADLFYKPLLKEAWGITKKYYWFIFAFILINVSVSLSFAKAGEKYLAIALFSIIVSIILKFWSQRLSIWVASKKDFKFSDIFNSFDNFKKYFVTSLIYGLIILGGFILLIVPGIIWTFKYFLAPYFSIDKGMNYKEALKASADATSGVKAKIFGLFFLALIIVIISALPLLLGLFVTIPLLYVLQGLLYVRLSSNTKEGAVVDNVIAQPVAESNSAPEATVVV